MVVLSKVVFSKAGLRVDSIKMVRNRVNSGKVRMVDLSKAVLRADFIRAAHSIKARVRVKARAWEDRIMAEAIALLQAAVLARNDR